MAKVIQREQSYVRKFRDQRRKNRAKAIIILGAKCKKCSFNDIRALQIDHVNDDGGKERTLRARIDRLIIKKLVDRRRYQLLCANCNWIKRIRRQKDCNRYLLSINNKLKKS
jgi:hypothetical protein